MPPRWTRAEVRAFALSLPEAHEHSHMGRPDLRVRNKIFATLPEDGRTVNLKCTREGLELLLRSAPETYHAVWNGRWLAVILCRADPDELEALLLEAYCLAAPRTLAAQVRAKPPAG